MSESGNVSLPVEIPSTSVHVYLIHEIIFGLSPILNVQTSMHRRLSRLQI